MADSIASKFMNSSTGLISWRVCEVRQKAQLWVLVCIPLIIRVRVKLLVTKNSGTTTMN